MPLLILGIIYSHFISLLKTVKYTYKLVAIMTVEVSRCPIKLLMLKIQIPQIAYYLQHLWSQRLLQQHKKWADSILRTSKGSSKHDMEVRVATVVSEYSLIDFRPVFHST